MTMNEKILKESTQALAKRLKNYNNYNQAEIDKITNLEVSLIGRETEIDEQSTEILRGLCAHSNFDEELEIKKSHRKFIGPVIYSFKKILARLTKVILKKQLKQISSIAHANTAATINLYRKQLEASKNID